MNITDGADFLAKRKAAQMGYVTVTASSVASAGIVLSIADAIAGKDVIHSRKIMSSAFKKIGMAAYKLKGVKTGGVELDAEEAGIMELVGTAVKSAAMSVLSSVGTVLMDAFVFAASTIIVPVFTYFCEAVAATIGLLVANPLVALGVGLTVGLGYLGYKQWQNYKNSTGTDDLGAEDMGAARTQAPTKPLVSTSPIAPRADSKGALADRIAHWRKTLDLPRLERAYGLPSFVLSALMAQESGGNPKARSRTGAKGLFQFTTIAVQDLKRRMGMTIDPDNPQQAAEGAAKYFGWLYKLYNGDVGKALTAYNAGTGTVAKVERGEGVFSTENSEYAGRVIGHWLKLNPFADVPKAVTPAPFPSPPAAPRTSTGFIIPTSGTYTSMFGVTRTINGETKEHKGIDIANAEGTPIYASAAGTVTVSGPAGGYGNLIRIAHAGGMDTLYGHARKLLVAKGDKVTQGQLIAEMGNLGKSTGPHLHFEVVEGGTVKDPTEYLAGFPKQQLAKVEYAAPVVVVAPTAQMGYITYKGKQVAYRQS